MIRYLAMKKAKVGLRRLGLLRTGTDWTNAVARIALAAAGISVVGCSASGDEGNNGPNVIRDEPLSVATGGSGGGDGVADSTPSTEATFGTIDIEQQQEAPGCQQASRSFDPEIPTVFLLVDRSDSMFSGNPSPWEPLRAGVLQVIEELQGSVRFAFSAFTGENGGVCPDMQITDAALNNFTAISSQYMSLGQATLDNPNNRETPTLPALDAAARSLWGGPGTGDKYILYVTDGEPDYCDDGPPVCPTDSVTGKLQQLSLGLDSDGAQNAPIQTFVFGIQTEQTNIPPETLQAFANAGAGQPVAFIAQNANAIFDPCQGVAGWLESYIAAGKPTDVATGRPVRGNTTAEYSAAGGTATVYRPDPNDQTALVEQIRSALSGIKSCEFNLGEDGVEVDLSRTDLGDKAHILLNGEEIPLDDTNGWHLLDASTVELVGSACDTWRAPVETSIDFDFPCDIILLK